jgi:HK97 family phage major capsid protein
MAGGRDLALERKLMLADPIFSGLRSAFEAKRTEAQEAWAVFEGARDEAVSSGVDLRKDVTAVKRLDDLHSAYKAIAEEASDLQERMLRAIDGKSVVLPGEASRDGVKSLGAEFLKRMGAGTAGLKALDGTTGGTMIPPFFDPQIRLLPQRQLFVRSLLPVRIADGDKVWYLRQTVAEQNAQPVAPHGIKPNSVYTIERIEEPVRVIAHVSEALDRSLLIDFEQLTEFIDQQLRLGVLLAEENQIINGDGTGVNMTGILNTAGIQVQARGTDSQADAIYKGITKIREQFMEPDGIVLHPSDWQTIRLSKDSIENYLSGTVIQADPDQLWGKQVITSTVLAQGTGLVGAFAIGASVYDREQARITFTEQGLSDVAGEEMFTKNEIRFRGEERIAFGVERPAAFCEITGL